MPWLYPTEVFPNEVRTRGAAFDIVGRFVGERVYYIIGASNGSPHKREDVFGIINVLTLPVIYGLYPETANRTLGELDFLFGHKTPWVREAEKRFAELRSESGLLTGTGDTSHKAQEKFFKGVE